MRFRAPEFEVDEKDPFKNDKLDIRASIEYITNLISNVDDALVIGIDGKYGTGKSTFLRIWRQFLINNGFATIYFNAWENDFSDKALVTLLGELNEGIDKLAGEDKKEGLKDKLSTLKNLGSRIIIKSLPLLARIGTAGFLDLKDKDIESALSAFSESVVNDEISRYQESKDNLVSFREELNGLAQEISGDANKKLVIIIDELDRCRPNYAVEILEVAKHFFNVPNIVFVLGVDKNQLGNSMKMLYGFDLDVDGYLRRFIDLDYLLPKPPLDNFIDHLIGVFELDKNLEDRKKVRPKDYDKDRLKWILSNLFPSMGISLRAQEQCMAQIAVALLAIKKDEPFHILIFSTLLCIKIANRTLYEDFLAKRKNSSDIVKYLDENFQIDDRKLMDIIKAFLIISQMNNNQYIGFIQHQHDIAANPDAVPEVKMKASDIVRVVASDDVDIDEVIGSIDSIIRSIEISSQFSVIAID